VADWRASALIAGLAIASTGAICGCGGSSSISGSHAAAPAATTAGMGANAVLADAPGYARKVNLRPSDLPGFRPSSIQEPGFVVSPGHEGPVSSGAFDAWIEHCDGGVSPRGSRAVVGYSSLHSIRVTRVTPAAAEGVRSVVFVFAGQAGAQHELAVLRSARARACLKADGDTKRGAGSEKRLEISAPHTAPDIGAYGVSWSAIPSSFRPPRRRYRDLFAFTSGRALIVLDAVSSPRPFDAALEARLLRLLYSRAQAHTP
jgi:hypothetical protein